MLYPYYVTVFLYITYGNNLIRYWATWAFKDICEPLSIYSTGIITVKLCQ
jgi:hypothetical protein